MCAPVSGRRFLLNHTAHTPSTLRRMPISWCAISGAETARKSMPATLEMLKLKTMGEFSKAIPDKKKAEHGERTTSAHRSASRCKTMP
jgi:hypothetical protein